MNDAEVTFSKRLKTPHGNAKRVYPFWKTCKVCSTHYPCHTKERATRSATCSKACANLLVGTANKGRPSTTASPLLTCPVCGGLFRRAPSKRRGARDSACSHQCRGVRDADLMRLRAATGRAGWTEASMASYLTKMTGAGNPAWKGGVTYFQKKGNYKPVKYVRCPPEFVAMARKDGYVMEHRLFVAQAMGRTLTRQEVVHHEDHDPTSNAIHNLALFPSNRDHKLFEAHGSPLPIWCGSRLSATKEPPGA